MRHHLIQAAIAVLAASLAAPALTQGFPLRDMAEIQVDPSAFTSGVFVSLPRKDRLMIACLECDRTAVVGLKIGPADADTVASLRSGTLTLADMEIACQATQDSPVCLRVEQAVLGPAVGWMTMTRVGTEREIRTYELFLGGERLIIQAIAESRDEADALGRIAFEAIAPQIVAER